MTYQNQILARLTDNERGRIQPHLSIVRLERGERLSEPQSKISKVYFPHSGVFSFVVELPGGGAVETAIVGNDGVFGAAQALNDQVSLNSVLVQMSGEASVIDLYRLRDLALELPGLRKALTGYEVFLFGQAQQTGACNAVHRVRERICKWLARMQDIAGDELPLTQEFLAQMMGVRRTSVGEVAQTLQRDGMLEYSRGTIRIKDGKKLRDNACDCYADVAGHYKVIIGDDPLET
ncbi:Crp/Fnr family transcriptional regulator [Tardiphaga sp.]|uniref:Crp/Fnr family transcriptional regulator n=1 Tax=Tardiphaga sp. TaxID=1926292 RepID=UPI0037DA67CF